MKWFKQFYLDKEKDMIVDLYKDENVLFYILSTPNHRTGNLITNLARLCGLPLSKDEQDFWIIKGSVPSYIDGYNRLVYIFRLGNTKVANIYPDGRIEMKASIPAISKTLMSQTKDYHPDIRKTIVKTYIPSECKFRTDLHTHMNANLSPDLLIALGISRQIRYPLYYIKKLELRCSEEQNRILAQRREETALRYRDSALKGKYLTRRIDDHTYLNFADLILKNPGDAAYNIPRIRRSLSVLKDGQAVFTNLEKVYLYRYVFTKGTVSDSLIDLTEEMVEGIPDPDIKSVLLQMMTDRASDSYRSNTLFQDKLLWIARSYARQGIRYAEIADTTLVKKDQAKQMLAQVHEVMPEITRETGVTLRFLAAIRRIPLTIVKDKVVLGDYFLENLETLREIAADPYVAGSDIVGEELNDIRDIRHVISELVKISAQIPSFVIRIHAGENDSLRGNVANSILCVKESLQEGQRMPHLRIGHGLYTTNLKSPAGRDLIRLLRESGAVLEFQITSNVRLNNLSDMKNHPLRQYLAQGIDCVQGTDGGALYGTDSIDEQLSLEKMLELSEQEMMQMRQCEDVVLKRSLQEFAEKTEAWERGIRPVFPPINRDFSRTGSRCLLSSGLLAERIRELPGGKLPIVLIGGSFNNDRHRTVMQEDCRKTLDHLLERMDPDKVFFITGHAQRGYERYLIEQNSAMGGKFEVFSMVPAMLTREEYRRIQESPVGIRISIEPVPMGIYKSFAYEIFKRRTSVLLAFDGNSAGANMIQEAKNSRYHCGILVNLRSKGLRTKAETLEGYVTLFSGEEEVFDVIDSML